MSDDDLARLRTILRETYSDVGVDIWLAGSNRYLDDRRPLDLIADGRIGEVIVAAERIEGSR